MNKNFIDKGFEINVLLVEDNPSDARLVQTYLDIHPENKYKFIVHLCNSIKQSREMLGTREFDIVLHDISLPDNADHRLEFLDYYHLHYPELPIIVMSGQSDVNFAIRAVERGAQDYLVKDQLNEFSLRRTILYARERFQFQRTLKVRTAETKTIMDAVPEHIAVLDDDGNITAVNQAWVDFSKENDGNSETTGVGMNYLEVCYQTEGVEQEYALTMAAGIQQVLAGERQNFQIEYPCHSNEYQRWFMATVTPLEYGSGCVVSHTNISSFIYAQETDAKRTQELNALHEITRSFSEIGDRDRLFASLTKKFAEMFDADACVITMRDIEEKLVEAQSPAFGIPEELIEKFSYSTDYLDEIWDIKLKGPFIANGVENIPAIFKPFIEKLAVESVLAVPFFKQNEVAGTVILMRKQDDFRSEEVGSLKVLAQQTGTLVEKAELFDLNQRELKHSALLHRVGQLCIEIQEEEQLLTNFTKIVKTELNLDQFGILIFQKESERLIPHQSYGLPKEIMDLRLNIGEGVAGQALMDKKLILVPDVEAIDNYVMVDPLTRSELVAPLIIDDQILGVINVECYQKGYFDDTHLKLFSTLANLVTSAIERIRQVERERKQRILAESLQHAVRATNRSLDIEAIMEEILLQVKNVLPVKYANVMAIEDGMAKVACAIGYDEHESSLNMNDIQFSVNQNPVIRGVVQEKKTWLITDTYASEDWIIFPETRWVRSFVSSPIQIDGTVYGMLNLDSPIAGFFNEEHAVLLEYFSDQVAVAMKNARLFQDLEQAYEATLDGWVRNLAMRDDETEEHTRRVTTLTIELARKLGVPKSELLHYRRGALLHDIGKMGIPDSILHKAGKLTEDEWKIMRKHPVYAYELLKEIDYLRPALDIPACHHERYDGSGYPEGLKGKEIPLAARIFAIVDIWDALSHDRPYRKAWPQERVVDYLKATSGKEIDPDILPVFLQLLQYEEEQLDKQLT